MEPRPANVIAWMAFLLVLTLAGFIAASAEWQPIVGHLVIPVFDSGAGNAIVVIHSQAEEVRLRAGIALTADMFVVMPFVLVAVVVCAAPAGGRRAAWVIGGSVAVSFVAGVAVTRLFLIAPVQNSGRVIDLIAYAEDIRPAQYTLFFAGTLLVGGITFVLPSVYALARMRSPAAARVVVACGTAILVVVLGAVVMPGFGLSPVFGQLVILSLAFAIVFAVERLGRLAFSDA